MSHIPAVNTPDQALQSSTPSRFQEMSSEDFIRIIFTELSNQDPFQPNDTSALLNQLESIRSIESDIQLRNQLETLVTENQLATASNLLGKIVSGRTTDLDQATGYVVSVVKQGDEISLELESGLLIPIKNIENVLDPNMFDATEPQTP